MRVIGKPQKHSLLKSKVVLRLCPKFLTGLMMQERVKKNL
jgi:hypothetical protein